MRILLTASTGLPREKIEEITQALPEVECIIVDDTLEAMRNAMPHTQALIGCPRPFFSKELLELAGNSLRWIHVPGAGCEEFLIPELIESDVVLTNGRVIQGPEVADHALALLLTLTRNIHFVLRGTIGTTIARPSDKMMPRPVELRNKLAIVVGAGGIGMLIAERLHAFGMTVYGVDQECIPMIRSIDRWYVPECLSEVLSLADVVILSVPVTSRTKKMFGAKEFALMKPSAYFVNVCRGAIVDTEALTEALKQGRIKSAGLDVTDPEPLPVDHPLLNMENVVITPHIAGPSDNNRERSAELIRQNIERFVKGFPLINVVNKKLGY